MEGKYSETNSALFATVFVYSLLLKYNKSGLIVNEELSCDSYLRRLRAPLRAKKSCASLPQTS